jgi:heme/copper-type cytochrome/quinol oxidase subunit 4
MKFYQETAVTGNLILIKTSTLTVPHCPVIAQSAKAAAPRQSLIVRFILYLAFLIGPLPVVPSISPATKARFAVLIIVALAFVEVFAQGVAQGYIEKSLGVG